MSFLSVLQATDSVFPGAVFATSSGIAFILFILATFVHISLKGQKISDVTKEGSGRLDPPPEEFEDKQSQMDLEPDPKLKVQARKLAPDTFENDML